MDYYDHSLSDSTKCVVLNEGMYNVYSATAAPPQLHDENSNAW